MDNNEFKRVLIQSGVASEDSILGLSEGEIKELEKLFLIEFPENYKSFLRACGKKAGNLGSTLNLFYPAAKTNKESLFEVVEEWESDFKIPHNIFVFSSYEDSIFDYFICDGKEDPIIYRIDEDKEDVEDRGITFLDLFFRLVETCDDSENKGSVKYSWDGNKVVETPIY